MSHWEKMMQEAAAAASAAFARMKEADARGDSRASKKAWRESEKFRDDERRFRAMCADWKVSSSGFAS
jgi:hypothetical protein